MGGRTFAVPILGLAVCLFGVLATVPALAQSSIIERERGKRAGQLTEAQDDLLRGDQAYEAGNYAEAVAAYGAARDKVGPAPLTRDLWVATNERFAQAAVERARQLVKTGSHEEAHQLLDTVLTAGVAPDHAGATQLKAQIDDPIRYNPALDPQHVVNVDKVRRLLYEAEGFASLGRYEQARAIYEEVLRIDPTNTAARRGQEAVLLQVRNYSDAAYDETRTRMLAEVDAEWEFKPNPVVDPDFLGGVPGGPGIGARSTEEKLRSIIIPQIDLDGVNLEEAVAFLRQTSADLDLAELDPEQQGVSFVVDLGTAESEVAQRIRSQRFDLKLKNVPLGKVLEYITEATQTFSRVDEYAVVIRPRGVTDRSLLTKTFRVPPDFLSRQPVGNDAAADDPFADAGPQQAVIPERLTAREFLAKQGVPFPDGASASFQSGANLLRVTNTQSNLEFVEQIVIAIAESEPVVVVIESRIINTSQDLLEELGFDWITSGGRLMGDVFLGGGTVGNGTSTGDFGGTGLQPLTSGLRSGALTGSDDSIDALIRTGAADGGASTGIINPRAPGILTVAGVWDSTTVATLMRGFDNKKAVDQVTKKSVVTRSGQKAEIESVIEFIYPTEYEPPELPSTFASTSAIDLTTGETASAFSSFATPATPTAFETAELGCFLEVEPLVGPNKRYVDLAIKPTVRRFDGFINYGTPITGGSVGFDLNLGGIGNPAVPSFVQFGGIGEITANTILMPVFSVITSDSNLTIADGQTVVMGGLLQDNHIKYEDKVPFLGDIPLIGRLFRSESETHNRDALVIMVTVRLLDPSGQPFRNR